MSTTDKSLGADGTKAKKREITREIARYAVESRYSKLPDNVRHEAVRAFLNWVGCALAGSRESAVHLAASMVADIGSTPQATVIGHGLRTDVASAAFLNCISSAILAFDDAHLPTVAHPSSPAGASLFAFSEHVSVSGEEFLNAIALSIEVTCRLSNAMLLPPSKLNLGFYINGLTSPIGVAVSVGRLLRLDEQKMRWAISIAASQSSGFRSTAGTMTAHFRPAHATRAGVVAALLAAKGFDASENALEETNGLFAVFAADADLNRAVDGLGQHHEMLMNGYKPYPCGIVIHPTIDACLEVRGKIGASDRIAKVTVKVNPVVPVLTGIRAPKDPLEANNSMYHWVAAPLVRGRAGLSESQKDCIDDPIVAALRTRVQLVPDPAIGKDEVRSSRSN